MNFAPVPLEGRRGNKVRNSVDVCGARVDWDGDETVKRWDPWGVQNSSMLAKTAPIFNFSKSMQMYLSKAVASFG